VSDVDFPSNSTHLQIQRTPIRAATGGMFGVPLTTNWQAGYSQRQRLPGQLSDRSDSANEVEGMLYSTQGQRMQAQLKPSAHSNHFPGFGPRTSE
jgi:hypothetical protein